MKMLVALLALLGLVLVFLFAWPIPGIRTTRQEPLGGYEKAVAGIRAERSRDTVSVSPECHSILLDHGQRTARVYLFFHGITNCPMQFMALGQRLYETGANVYIPRLPHHGLGDRMTTDLAELQAQELADFADRELDLAVGLGDTVVVSGAAGGVGSVTVQLARRAGATVIGLASPVHHEWLAGHGVIPVSYGDGVADRIRRAAAKVDAFIDTFGADYVRLALDLGVEPSRVDTIVRFDAVQEYGVKAEGNAAGASAAVLAELAGLIAAGELEIPIAATFPLDQVRDAYRLLAGGHVHGKIVLLP